MTYEEWFDVARTLKRFYQREEKFMPDEETVKVMYSTMSDLDYERTQDAVLNYIKANRFSPTVADIREEYSKLTAESKKDESEIRKAYDNARNYYPGSGEYGYGWKEWMERVNEAKPENRVKAANWLCNKITEYVNGCEKETMDFAECVRTIKA